MAVYFLPEFVADLQEHNDAHFARRVLRKILQSDGSFRRDADDHSYSGVEHAWIRVVSRGRTAYRVIYLRQGENVYFYRAGNHSIEDRLVGPSSESIDAALPITDNGTEVAEGLAAISDQEPTAAVPLPVNRFKRNIPQPQISREIFSRRNLPHSNIWLVAPFVSEELFAPTARFGQLLLDQVEDGASVTLVTAPPKDKSITWMEVLSERDVNIFVYPKLHTKLYCFVFDEDRRYATGLHEAHRYSSLILIGSANLTSAGMGLSERRSNEELCYSAPEEEIGFVEEYVIELMLHGYELQDVRTYKARGQWQKLEEGKW